MLNNTIRKYWLDTPHMSPWYVRLFHWLLGDKCPGYGYISNGKVSLIIHCARIRGHKGECIGDYEPSEDNNLLADF